MSYVYNSTCHPGYVIHSKSNLHAPVHPNCLRNHSTAASKTFHHKCMDFIFLAQHRCPTGDVSTQPLLQEWSLQPNCIGACCTTARQKSAGLSAVGSAPRLPLTAAKDSIDQSAKQLACRCWQEQGKRPGVGCIQHVASCSHTQYTRQRTSCVGDAQKSACKTRKQHGEPLTL